MNTPKKLTIVRKNLSSKQAGSKQSKKVQPGENPVVSTTSICPYVCW
jgi:hypothetical protein